MPVSNPIGDIAYHEYDHEMGRDNMLEISEQWRDRVCTVPCGSAYESHDFTHLAHVGMSIPPSLRNEHKDVLITPLEGTPDEVIEGISAATNGLVSLAQRKPSPGDPLIRTAVFCAAENPLDWIGAVSFQCRVVTGANAKVFALHEGTVVNAAYRRKSWAPVISGMCGLSLGYSLCEHIEDQFKAAAPTPLSLSVSVQPRHHIFPHVFLSFATALETSFYLLDATDFDQEPRYECRVLDAA